MMTLAIPFPEFLDPVAVEIGPLVVRWYALAYIVGLIAGWRLARRMARARPEVISEHGVDDLLMWATLGVVLGGRAGYVIFYDAASFVERPWEVFYLWQGGMSFHGGLLGVTLAIVLFCRRAKLSLLAVSDIVACQVPIGLFLGRIANFVNGELWGRVSDVPWAVIFPDPRAGGEPRHPSQLYEAVLEGAVLYLLLWFLRRRTGALDRPGELSGVFCVGYALARLVVEFFRQPDAQLGFLLGGATMGQLLSLPLLAFGFFLVVRARRRAGDAGA